MAEPLAAEMPGHHYCCLQVDEVKNIMSENIEKVLSRGEKLDLLVDKTDNLMFEVSAGQGSIALLCVRT
jgi:hypothetical protein